MTIGILAQVRAAKAHPFAAVMGALLGALPPLATYSVAHAPAPEWKDWAMVAAGLAFSVTTVYQWGNAAFGNRFKAVGYVVLLEALVVASPIGWLSQLALAYLMGINATATACLIAHDDQPEPLPTVTAVSRELSLPRKAAAKVVDRQIAARAPRQVPT